MMPKRWKITEIHDHWGVCREEDSQGDYVLYSDVQPILDRLPDCPPCDMGENTPCICKSQLVAKEWLDETIAERDEARTERDSLAASNKALREALEAAKDRHQENVDEGKREPVIAGDVPAVRYSLERCIHISGIAVKEINEALALPAPSGERVKALEDIAQEAANLCAWENGTAKERGKTAEGRTVTALIYALSRLESLGEKTDPHPRAKES